MSFRLIQRCKGNDKVLIFKIMSSYAIPLSQFSIVLSLEKSSKIES